MKLDKVQKVLYTRCIGLFLNHAFMSQPTLTPSEEKMYRILYKFTAQYERAPDIHELMHLYGRTKGAVNSVVKKLQNKGYIWRDDKGRMSSICCLIEIEGFFDDWDHDKKDSVKEESVDDDVVVEKEEEEEIIPRSALDKFMAWMSRF